jgi:hypothetical protein
MEPLSFPRLNSTARFVIPAMLRPGSSIKQRFFSGSAGMTPAHFFPPMHGCRTKDGLSAEERSFIRAVLDRTPPPLVPEGRRRRGALVDSHRWVDVEPEEVRHV